MISSMRTGCKRVGQAHVGNDRETEDLHAGVDRDQDFGDGRHSHHVGADAAQEAVFGPGLEVGPDHRNIDTAMGHNVLLRARL